MRRSLVAASAVFLAAGLTTSHAEVTDPDIIARIEGMKVFGGSLQVLGNMARGNVAFDAATANAALAAIAAEAPNVAAKFEAEATDPESKALPVIWSNWDDFVAKAEAFEVATANLTVASAEDLGATMRSLGGACQACHSAYRE